jgi:hypothetical protein
MRSRLAGILLATCLISPAFAADTPPSDASLHELLDVMHAHSTLDSTMKQVEDMMHSSVESGLAGKSLDEGQRKIVESGEAKMSALIMSAMTWDKMEPMYLGIYRRSFSQKEVDDMLTFYRSPSGQAVVAKLPVVTQETMKSVQAEISTLTPDIQRISRETASELQAYNASKTRPASPP